MKSIVRFCLLSVALWFLALAGCEIETLEGPGTQFSPSSTVVINEVFTLSETDPGRYNWIEFYNPTERAVDLTGWTMEFNTYRLRATVTVAFDSLGIGTVIAFPGYEYDSLGTFPVPIAGLNEPDLVIRPPIVLEPRGLLTIVDNETKLRDHTNWGPGDDRFRYVTTRLFGPVDDVDTISTSDSLTIIRAGWNAYGFFLRSTDQLVLRNAVGEVVDVVRYGDYRWPGPGGDPYPGNQSVGFMPPNESVCRYARGFKSNPMPGNTANDFFITDVFVRPIPHWPSGVEKPQ